MNGNKAKQLTVPLDWDEKTMSIIKVVHTKPRKIVTRKNSDSEVEGHIMNYREIRKAEQEYNAERDITHTTTSLEERNTEQVRAGLDMLLQLAEEEADAEQENTPVKQKRHLVTHRGN